MAARWDLFMPADMVDDVGKGARKARKNGKLYFLGMMEGVLKKIVSSFRMCLPVSQRTGQAPIIDLLPGHEGQAQRRFQRLGPRPQRDVQRPRHLAGAGDN